MLLWRKFYGDKLKIIRDSSHLSRVMRKFAFCISMRKKEPAELRYDYIPKGTFLSRKEQKEHFSYERRVLFKLFRPTGRNLANKGLKSFLTKVVKCIKRHLKLLSTGSNMIKCSFRMKSSFRKATTFLS